ncbi:MAG: hypothetical protein AB7O38_10920 [Pirellulaceae bacterium]
MNNAEPKTAKAWKWVVWMLLVLAGPGSLVADSPLVRVADVVGGHIHPSVCVTKKGTLIVTYGRINHRDLRLTRSMDGGQTWSEPVPFAPTVGKTYYPGSLTSLSNGQVIHAWNRWSSDTNESEPRSVVYAASDDDGLTWSAPQPFPRDPQVRSVIRHPFVELETGHWLVSLDDRTFVFDPASRMPESFGVGR